MKEALRIVAVVTPLLAASCDCGSNGPGWQVPDALADGEWDVSEDAPADGTEVPDLPDDGASDPDAVDDVTDEDASTHAGSPFVGETCGGGLIESESYSIELFLAPVRPTGVTSNDSYTIILGPAGMRRP